MDPKNLPPISEVAHLRHQGIGIDSPDRVYSKFFLGLLGFLGFNVGYTQRTSHAVHWTQEYDQEDGLHQRFSTIIVLRTLDEISKVAATPTIGLELIGSLQRNLYLGANPLHRISASINHDEFH